MSGKAPKDAKAAKAVEKKRMVLEQMRKEVDSLTTQWKVTTYLSGGSYGEVCGGVEEGTRV